MRLRRIGTQFDRVRVDLNTNSEDIEREFGRVNKRIADQLTQVPQPSEVIDARNGEPSLSIRLEKDKDETAIDIAQVNQTLDMFARTKADLSYVETMLSTVLGGSPRGIYTTLSALRAAYPNGTDGVFLVLENGHIYFWNGSAWTDAGVYQGIEVPDRSITEDKFSDDLANGFNTPFVNRVPNGDFKEDSLAGYSALFGTVRLSKYVDGLPELDTVILTANGSNTFYGATLFSTLAPTVPTRDKWYVKSRLRTLTGDGFHDLRVGFRGVSGVYHEGTGLAGSVVVNRWYDISALFDPQEVTNLTGELRLSVAGTYDTNISNNGKMVEVDSVFVVNLSQIFGYGNEPTKEVMDKLLADFDPSLSIAMPGNLSGANTKHIIQQEQKIQDINQDLESVQDTDIENKIFNGNFADGTAGWSAESGTSIATESGTLTITGTGSNTQPRARQETTMPYAPDTVLFVQAVFKATNPDCTRMGFAVFSEVAGDTIQYVLNDEFEVGEDVKIGGIVTLPEGSSGNVRIQLRSQYPTAEISQGKSVEVSKVVVINLTEAFGRGKEPSADDISALVGLMPNEWFSGKAKIKDTQKALIEYVFERTKNQKTLDVRKPIIALTLDDGYASDYDIVYPLLRARGIRATSYIWTARTGVHQRAMTWDQLHDLKNDGWGIECHTHDHPRLGDMTDDQIREQMELVNAAFEENGFPHPRHHALPYGSGSNEERVRKIIMEYRKTCRKIGAYSDAYNTYGLLDFSALNAKGTDIYDGNKDTLIEERKSQIDDIVANRGMGIWVSHEFKLDGAVQYETKLELFKIILDYALDKDVEFVTLEEFYRRELDYRLFNGIS